ncbi:MAG: hypothetical protein JST92_10255, partial [Deltaproteobacteria bacterium]|nr:hypothetical protein [Deltaproteobacteria bacterium]
MLALAVAVLAASPLAATPLVAKPLALPGGPPVSMDYLAFDASTGRLWIPAGSTGRIDVLDTATGKLEGIGGLATKANGERVMGVSSAFAGDGLVFVGSRADASLCAYDAKTLAKKSCLTLASNPDGVAYVSTTHEVWVTLPRADSLAIVGNQGGVLSLSATMKLEGGPEGYAVDAASGTFFTNLEDKDKTLAIDVKARKVVSTWAPECGAEGPRGLAFDGAHQRLYVACTTGLRVLDLARNGALAGKLETGAGADNIDYLASRDQVFIASGKEGKLTIARAAKDGSLTAL